MNLSYRAATKSDFQICTRIRGSTRDNAIPEGALREMGIDEAYWFPRVDSGQIVGEVCEFNGEVIGFSNGDTTTGEIIVLALLAEFDGRGIGKELLSRVSNQLFALGWDELWLAASVDPSVKAHGFYRHLGWVPTGRFGANGDEILSLKKP